MAASNKSVGLQITLAIFAMMAIIGWVAFYMQFRELADNKARFDKAGADKQVAENGARKSLDDIEAFKAAAGYNQPDVGADQQGAANTILGAITVDLAKVNADHGPLPTTTLAAAVQFLSQRVADLKSERDQFQTQVNSRNTDLAGLRGQYQTQVNQHQQARQSAERDLAQLRDTTKEQLDARQKQIEDLRRNLTDLQVEFDEATATWTSERKKYVADLSQLEVQVDDLRDKLKNATRQSFERPDGLVRWIDNTAGLVWINLGSQDRLRLRTTFSVYRKAHHGVARGAEDIKGQIEVTRIIDGHTSEARILDDDIYDPISKGDPVYTPLWSPGRTEMFAVIGQVDLDQDGVLDRDQFHDLIADAGAKLNHEVLDDGTRIRYEHFPDTWLDWNEGDPELDSDTKYLILADIPDPALAIREEDKIIRQAISAHLLAMRNEARRLGIEEIRLSDFLAHVGYKPQRRLYVPGLVDRPFNLKAGAASVGTNEVVGDRTAAGAVSGIYGRSKKLKPQSSAGTTSDLFRGGSLGGN
ncbi:MAG: hypothetical protein O3B13_21175 [Planctomycetota bacterium]|nr:hypothetical protein [Planctomycetota bacterium]MDA1165617.1 hypothetical protein [Planctomycetota bacterium]